MPSTISSAVRLISAAQASRLVMRFHIAPHNIGFADRAPQQRSAIPGARLTVKNPQLRLRPA